MREEEEVLTIEKSVLIGIAKNLLMVFAIENDIITPDDTYVKENLSDELVKLENLGSISYNKISSDEDFGKRKISQHFTKEISKCVNLNEWIDVNFAMPETYKQVLCDGTLDGERQIFAGWWNNVHNLQDWYCCPESMFSDSRQPKTVVNYWKHFPSKNYWMLPPRKKKKKNAAKS